MTEYQAVIDRAFPGLRRGEARLNCIGQNSDVLIVDERYVFRFPKYPAGIEALQLETALLNELHGRMPLPVPNPEFVHLAGQPVGAACVGHRLLPGEPLWRETLLALPEADQAAIAGQLGGFLAALHRFPPSPEMRRMLPRSETRAEIEDLYARLQAKVFPHLSSATRLRAAAHFEDYLSMEPAKARFSADGANPDADSQYPGYTQILRHGDFGPSNILYDPAARRPSGVIDFAGAALGDPAADLAGLLSGYGEAFLLRSLEVYPDATEMLPRIRFHQGTFALQEALFGVENGDKDALRAGIAGVEG